MSSLNYSEYEMYHYRLQLAEMFRSYGFEHTAVRRSDEGGYDFLVTSQVFETVPLSTKFCQELQQSVDNILDPCVFDTQVAVITSHNPARFFQGTQPLLRMWDRLEEVLSSLERLSAFDTEANTEGILQSWVAANTLTHVLTLLTNRNPVGITLLDSLFLHEPLLVEVLKQYAVQFRSGSLSTTEVSQFVDTYVPQILTAVDEALNGKSHILQMIENILTFHSHSEQVFWSIGEVASTLQPYALDKGTAIWYQSPDGARVNVLVDIPRNVTHQTRQDIASKLVGRCCDSVTFLEGIVDRSQLNAEGTHITHLLPSLAQSA